MFIERGTTKTTSSQCNGYGGKVEVGNVMKLASKKTKETNGLMCIKIENVYS